MVNWTWWQKSSPYWTERWDLAICRFRDNIDITDWEATKLGVLPFRGGKTGLDVKRVIPLGNVIWLYSMGKLVLPWRIFGKNYQSYNVNVITIWLCGLHNLSRHVILLERITSGVLIRWGYIKFYYQRYSVNVMGLFCNLPHWENEYSLVWSYHSTKGIGKGFW